MSGETNLDKLLQSMQPALRDGAYVFCTMDMREEKKRLLDMPEDQRRARQLAFATLAPVMSFQEEEGVTLIVNKIDADRVGLAYETGAVFSMITLTVHSSLQAVGFLAKITERLAAEQISVNAVSAYFHDHLFVPQDRAADAMAVLHRFTEQPKTALPQCAAKPGP